MRREPVRVCRHTKNTSLCANEYSMGQDFLTNSMAHGTAFKGGVDNHLLDPRIMMALRRDQPLKEQQNSGVLPKQLYLPRLLCDLDAFDSDTTTATKDINHNSRTSPPILPKGFIVPKSSTVMSPVKGYPQSSLANKLNKYMVSSDSTNIGNGNPQSQSASKVHKHTNSPGSTDMVSDAHPQSHVASTLHNGYPQNQLASKLQLCIDSTADSPMDVTTRFRTCPSPLSAGSSSSPFSSGCTSEPTSPVPSPVDDHFEVQFLNRLSREWLRRENPHLLEPSSCIGNYAKLAPMSLEKCIGSLESSYQYLNMSGWYFGPLTMGEARERLRPHPVGTFLLRDSSDPNFMFALSFKTRRGTTSVRIIYENGRFRMDAEAGTDNEHYFSCIMHLVQNYVIKTKNATPDSTAQRCMLLESTGRMDTPLRLSRGCVKGPRGLKHMSRVALNKSLSEEQRRRLLLFMPPDIESYMKEYPFRV